MNISLADIIFTFYFFSFLLFFFLFFSFFFLSYFTFFFFIDKPDTRVEARDEMNGVVCVKNSS